MSTKLIRILVLLFCTSLLCCEAWLLAQLGLNESYRVKHLSTHFSRVFLCIEVKSKTFPTLIEAQWPETYLPMRTLIYPQRAIHANGNHHDCSRIHQARWSQVDNYSRLWVLDIGWQNGTQHCPPKLLVFDLIRNNAEVLRIDCSHYLDADDKSLLAIQMGPRQFNGRIEKYIYFLRESSSILLAYDIVEQSWHRRKLVSRKYRDIDTPLPIYPIDMAFSKHPRNVLLISDADGKLYVTPNFLLEIENNIIDRYLGNATVSNNTDNVDTMELELMGSLLGRTKGMMVDYLGALFYAVPKYGAIVRCIYKQNLTAENNEIIYMTPKNIKQIFFGFENSVWLLSDRWLNPQDHCFSGV